MYKKSMKAKMLMGLMLLPVYAGAQNIKVQGTVVASSDGEPLPGVTVSIEGTNIATVTDLDGKYTIDAKAKGKLKFTYIGFKTTFKPFATSTQMDVKLEDDANMLDEVVAIGYGSLKKSDLTQSMQALVSQVKLLPFASVVSVLSTILLLSM